MLMMLASWAKPGPADAHDAGGCGTPSPFQPVGTEAQELAPPGIGDLRTLQESDIYMFFMMSSTAVRWEQALI